MTQHAAIPSGGRGSRRGAGTSKESRDSLAVPRWADPASFPRCRSRAFGCQLPGTSRRALVRVGGADAPTVIPAAEPGPRSPGAAGQPAPSGLRARPLLVRTLTPEEVPDPGSGRCSRVLPMMPALCFVKASLRVGVLRGRRHELVMRREAHYLSGLVRPNSSPGHRDPLLMAS